ncbi:hypothetical protein DLAC_00697 [Tieghemostelium lacteum]|uniref:PD-(D/E)XK endonuclease-like domain-containing protein n=1 Tax=Tieghemostelium lacteum TaxID=361077 RepID=A0A152A8V1_TIELA|nr:hypothetical protein DLAC_00697 [Tieghemostelium lacteum]|eukprot:KYR02561.1 hypothetical protein DLAC_00697 [Tieghemostelium lacteum]
MTIFDKFAKFQNVSRVYINGQRFYKIGDKEELYPSVTTVLQIIDKPQLNTWKRNQMLHEVKEQFLQRPKSIKNEDEWIDKVVKESIQKPQKVMQHAATIGTQAHSVIDQIIIDKTDEIPTLPALTEEELNKMEAPVKIIKNSFDVWLEGSGLEKVELRDTMFCSERYKFAGAIDTLGRKKDGSLVAIDWKTSSSVHTEYLLQVSAYAKAVEEISGEPVPEAWIVKFNKKEGGFDWKQVPNINESFDAFLSALNLWNFYSTKPIDRLVTIDFKGALEKFKMDQNPNNNSFFQSVDKESLDSLKAQKTKSTSSSSISSGKY